MFELVYCSTAKPSITQTDITNILNRAQEFNTKNNITGCLLYYDEEFIQILEGEKQIIQTLYADIVKDERHTNVLLIGEGVKKERTFPYWSMAYLELNKEHIKGFNKNLAINNFLFFSSLTQKPSPMVDVFWAMVRSMMEDKNPL